MAADRQRFEVVNLSSSPEYILSGQRSSLDPTFAEIIQPTTLWTLYHYHGINAVTINSRTYPVEAGDTAIFPPGSRVVHARTGEGTRFEYLTFDMPGKGNDRGAISHIVRADSSHGDWVKAGSRMQDSIVPLRAYAWNFMCVNSVNVSAFRQEAVLYDAETWIINHLAEAFTIADLCANLGISSRHLLRAFRQEHGITVQEFIIQRRVREAARLLMNTEKPAKVIAQEIGVPNLQHFNKLMRLHTGASPRAFRETKQR